MAANKPERSPRAQIAPDERYAAARAIYEGMPGMTFAKLAEETGLGKSTLERRANVECWKKNYTAANLPAMGEAAQKAADTYSGKVAEYGPEITDEQKAQVVAEVSTETAVDLRAQILDRHRREWAAPRKLAYEAMQKRDFELAKLAKINSETLRNIQDGERRAWGIDKANDGTFTVVIERGN